MSPFRTKLKKVSIGTKLPLAILLTITILLGVSFFLLINRQNNIDLNVKIENSVATANVVDQSIKYSMLQGEMDAVEEMISNTAGKNGIKTVTLFDSKGKVFTSSDRSLADMTSNDSYLLSAIIKREIRLMIRI